MDTRGQIYSAPENEVPPEDKARLDDWFTGDALKEEMARILTEERLRTMQPILGDHFSGL